jgi:hypothetical protein
MSRRVSAQDAAAIRAAVRAAVLQMAAATHAVDQHLRANVAISLGLTIIRTMAVTGDLAMLRKMRAAIDHQLDGTPMPPNTEIGEIIEIAHAPETRQ